MQVLRNVEHLLKMGHQVRLILVLAKGEVIPERYFFASGNFNLQISDNELLLSGVNSSIASLMTDQARFLLGFFRGLRAAFDRSILFVHVNNGGFPGAAGSRGFLLGFRLKRSNLPVIATVNNLAVGYQRPARWLDFLSDRALARLEIRWITASRAASSQLVSVLGLRHTDATTIPNGVPLPVCVHPPHDFLTSTYDREIDHIALSVGNLEARKGHSVLLEALAMLNQSNLMPPRWVFVIEGEGPERASLQNEIALRDLSRFVRLIGRVDCVAGLMKSATLFIHPSTSNEDLPNVISEAMALSKAVIASRVAGISEQIENLENGLLVDPGNASQLAEAIRRLASSDKLREAMGIEGRVRYSQLFMPEQATERYLHEYGLKEEK
jgi:glycosyltransferase involved in cell wall biosynthesis